MAPPEQPTVPAAPAVQKVRLLFGRSDFPGGTSAPIYVYVNAERKDSVLVGQTRPVWVDLVDGETSLLLVVSGSESSSYCTATSPAHSYRLSRPQPGQTYGFVVSSCRATHRDIRIKASAGRAAHRRPYFYIKPVAVERQAHQTVLLPDQAPRQGPGHSFAKGKAQLILYPIAGRYIEKSNYDGESRDQLRSRPLQIRLNGQPVTTLREPSRTGSLMGTHNNNRSKEEVAFVQRVEIDPGQYTLQATTESWSGGGGGLGIFRPRKPRTKGTVVKSVQDATFHAHANRTHHVRVQWHFQYHGKGRPTTLYVTFSPVTTRAPPGM